MRLSTALPPSLSSLSSSSPPPSSSLLPRPPQSSLSPLPFPPPFPLPRSHPPPSSSPLSFPSSSSSSAALSTLSPSSSTPFFFSSSSSFPCPPGPGRSSDALQDAVPNATKGATSEGGSGSGDGEEGEGGGLPLQSAEDVISWIQSSSCAVQGLDRSAQDELELEALKHVTRGREEARAGWREMGIKREGGRGGGREAGPRSLLAAACAPSPSLSGLPPSLAPAALLSLSSAPLLPSSHVVPLLSHIPFLAGAGAKRGREGGGA